MLSVLDILSEAIIPITCIIRDLFVLLISNLPVLSKPYSSIDEFKLVKRFALFFYTPIKKVLNI